MRVLQLNHMNWKLVGTVCVCVLVLGEFQDHNKCARGNLVGHLAGNCVTVVCPFKTIKTVDSRFYRFRKDLTKSSDTCGGLPKCGL